MKNGESKKPVIEPSQDGPYLVRDLNKLVNSKGENIATTDVTALCRCGSSSNKPYCDGTHFRIGFSSKKGPAKEPDRTDNYVGEQITIHDNRGVCSHAGHCTDNLPNVFIMGQEPWINPNAATPEEIIATIKKCPSGALSYLVNNTLFKDQDREPMIKISKDGPYEAIGGPELDDPSDSKPESKEHYTLCRCGKSRNKPFCDGTHWDISFKDEKN